MVGYELSRYSEADIQNIAETSLFWKQKFPATSRLEVALEKEFHLYLQYMMMNEADPLRPESQWLDRWLEPSTNLDVYDLRLRVLERLASCPLVRFSSEVPTQRGPALAYPDAFHYRNWRKYYSEIFKRSRAVFQSITTEKVIDLEKKTLPFYLAMQRLEKLDTSKSPLGDGFVNPTHLETHRWVAKKLVRLLRDKANGDYRILELGCGSGVLLRELGLLFPHSQFVATNLYGKWGVHPEVIGNSRVTILSETIEEAVLQAESFDAVISTEVIEHLVNPSDMVKRAHELLRPGGVFIMTAPSLHVQYLFNNPMTYLYSLLSLVWVSVLPPFHNLWEPLTDLQIIHYSFSYGQYRNLFRKYFSNAKIDSTRFTHLEKFKLQKVVPYIPILCRWGGILVASGRK